MSQFVFSNRLRDLKLLYEIDMCFMTNRKYRVLAQAAEKFGQQKLLLRLQSLKFRPFRKEKTKKQNDKKDIKRFPYCDVHMYRVSKGFHQEVQQGLDSPFNEERISDRFKAMA